MAAGLRPGNATKGLLALAFHCNARGPVSALIMRASGGRCLCPEPIELRHRASSKGPVGGIAVGSETAQLLGEDDGAA